MRSRKDVRNSNRHNETKLEILKIFTPRLDRWLTTLEIAEITGLEPNNASQQMKKLTRQNYIWRKNIGKKAYVYRFLKPMGDRILKRLWVRQKLIEETEDTRIDLNLEHPVPNEYRALNFETEQKFDRWLHGFDVD